MINKILFTVLVSRWTVLAEMLLVLVPTTFAALWAPFGILLLPGRPLFGAVVLMSVFGLVALWRLLFSLFQKNSARPWVFFGLFSGFVAALMSAFYLPVTILVFCPNILLGVHWFWLHREDAINLYKL